MSDIKKRECPSNCNFILSLTLYLEIFSFRIIDLYLEKQSYKYKIVKDHEIEISMSVLISEKKELVQKLIN